MRFAGVAPAAAALARCLPTSAAIPAPVPTTTMSTSKGRTATCCVLRARLHTAKVHFLRRGTPDTPQAPQAAPAVQGSRAQGNMRTCWEPASSLPARIGSDP